MAEYLKTLQNAQNKMKSLSISCVCAQLCLTLYHPLEPTRQCVFNLIPIYCVSIRKLEKAMAPHSSTLAWKILWMEEPGRLQSMGSQRVGHNWVTSLSLFTFMHWRRKWQPTPLQYSCLENPKDGGAWWAVVYGVTQSRTRLKRLSSSSSSSSIRKFL